SEVFGRVLVSARTDPFVADGAVHNGCPGEAVTPAELFLAGVVSCAVELVQVFARREEIPLRRLEASISGDIEPDNPVRQDLSVFNRIRLAFRLDGPTEEQAGRLVERFKET